MQKIRKSLLFAACFVCCMALGCIRANAAGTQPVATVEELTEAMMNAEDGDTILVGDITFQPMPMGMMQVPKNLAFKSGMERNAVFTNATFALNGTANDAAPLKIRFEGIDFVGDNVNGIDAENPPNVSSKIPGIMTTMCAGIFKMNLNVTYADCTFTGYHYGYGGVFNAIYSSDDNKNELKLTLENCVFSGNAGNYGGAMYLIGRNHNITLAAEGCTFEGNGAATGGAIWADNTVLDLRNCRFSSNQYLEGEVTSPVGGALALYNCDSELEACVIENNASAEGGGLFCEIAPFHTLVMRNCTVNGNKASVNSALSVVPGETNFSTEAKAYIYFSSIVNHEGEDGLADNDSLALFGCLVANQNTVEEKANEANGYCYKIPAAFVAVKGYYANEKGRIFVTDEMGAIPKEAVEAAAGGRYAAYAGLIVPGDFDPDTITALPVQTVANSDSTASESEETVKEEPETAETLAGSRQDAEATEPSDKSSYGWVPAAIVGILLFCCLIGAFVIWVYVKNKPGEKAEAKPSEETAEPLPENWIERVCEQPEIKNHLSARELEVLPLLLEGLSREQIAKKLFISESTVKKHASSIYAKLNVSGKAELIAKMAGK